MTVFIFEDAIVHVYEDLISRFMQTILVLIQTSYYRPVPLLITAHFKHEGETFVQLVNGIFPQSQDFSENIDTC